MKFVRSIAAVTLTSTAALLAGCAVEPEEDAASASTDALSQAECDGIVADAVGTAKRACDEKKSAADDKQSERVVLERNVGSALTAFSSELARYSGAGASAVRAATAECNAVSCSGELAGADVRAECSLEQTFLKAACYVRRWPSIKAAATSADFSDEMANLERALGAMRDNWVSLATQERALRAQHGACTTYVGSGAHRSALNATCRASCSDDAPTRVGSIQTGHGASCSPPGYEDVKDDLGAVVTCGTMKRPLRSLGAVCECAEERACTQFAALAGSSERGKRCTKTGGAQGFQRIVWDARARRATLECR